MKQLSQCLPSSKGRRVSATKNARIISQSHVYKDLISQNYSPQVCAALLLGKYQPKTPYDFLPSKPLPASNNGEGA